MSDKLVVALTGHPGSGKTTAANHIHMTQREAPDGRHHFGFYSPGASIRAQARELGMELNSRADSARFLIGYEGRQDDFVIDPVRNLIGDNVVLDGLRRMYDLEGLRAAPDLRVRVIAVTAPIEIRHARVLAAYKNRGGRDSFDLESFRQEELTEAWSDDPLRPSTEEVMGRADYTVENDFETLDEFLLAIDGVMKTIINEPPSQQR